MDWVKLFAIVLPNALAFIQQQQAQNPSATYAEILQQAGVELSAEHLQLLTDLAADLQEGAK